MKKTTNVIRRAAGYTIDQTILIVAVIAVLITLVIASVGWDILSRTAGTKMASNLRQIEDAAGQFYAAVRIWPHQAMGQADMHSNNILALIDVSETGVALPASQLSKLTNYLPSIGVNGATPPVPQHNFGGGGQIIGGPSDGGTYSLGCPGSDVHFVIQMDGIPVTEIEEADSAIDNGDDRTAGRFRWSTPSGGVANAFYCANVL